MGVDEDDAVVEETGGDAFVVEEGGGGGDAFAVVEEETGGDVFVVSWCCVVEMLTTGGVLFTVGVGCGAPPPAHVDAPEVQVSPPGQARHKLPIAHWMLLTLQQTVPGL